MDNRPIGVFDSGLGGLTAVKELLNSFPNENLIYFGDTQRVPYGPRSKDVLNKFVSSDINFLLSKDVKMIVVACGTASSVALPSIINNFNIPIIDVVKPACIEANKLTKNKNIAVLGTVGTINSNSFKNQLLKLDENNKIYQVSCPMFVPVVENGYTNTKVSEMIVYDYLKDLLNKNIDTVILGCTHYPLLEKEIKRTLGDSVNLINSGATAVKYAISFLKENDMLSDCLPGTNEYYVSDDASSFSHYAELFLEKKIDLVTKIDIDKF